MARRVCSESGCPTFTDSGRCTEHARQADRARGSRQQRGYDADYDREARRVKQGAKHCANCGQPFTADNPVTAGHVVAVRRGGSTGDGLRPECRRCNYGWAATDL